MLNLIPPTNGLFFNVPFINTSGLILIFKSFIFKTYFLFDFTLLNFSNSSGTYSPDNYSTVRDIALLSSYLINNYPQYYKYFKEKDFLWTRTGGNPIKQENRNTLLFTDQEVDGIKTGHLKDSKYSIAVTKKKDNRRIIVVISGLPTMSSRAESSRLLLNNSLSKIDLFKIPYDKDKFKIKIWNGSSNYLDVRGTNKDAIFINLPKNLKNPKIRTELVYEYPLQIPIKKFEKVAVLKIYNNKDLIDTQDLFAQKDITNKNIFFKGIQNDTIQFEYFFLMAKNFYTMVYGVGFL